MLDAILPPRCLSCAGAVDRQGTLCLSCWSGLTFISPPHCACCGEPFDVAMAVDAADSLLCATCIGEPPAYSRARSVLTYDDGCRGMILGFKHADQTYAATAFGAWLARAGADLLVPGRRAGARAAAPLEAVLPPLQSGGPAGPCRRPSCQA